LVGEDSVSEPNYRPQRLLFAIASRRAPTNIAPEKSLRPFNSIDARVRSFMRLSDVAPKRRNR
jgi:hypothetical protein